MANASLQLPVPCDLCKNEDGRPFGDQELPEEWKRLEFHPDLAVKAVFKGFADHIYFCETCRSILHLRGDRYDARVTPTLLNAACYRILNARSLDAGFFDFALDGDFKKYRDAALSCVNVVYRRFTMGPIVAELLRTLSKNDIPIQSAIDLLGILRGSRGAAKTGALPVRLASIAPLLSLHTRIVDPQGAPVPPENQKRLFDILALAAKEGLINPRVFSYSDSERKELAALVSVPTPGS